jgi:acyl carrier protein
MNGQPPPIPQVPPSIPAQAPPPLPKKKGRGTLGKILVAVGAVCVAFVVFQVALFVLALALGKAPRSRVPGEAEFREANRQIIRNTGSLGFGNNPEAVSLARNYSKGLKVLRQTLFTEGNKDAYSISKGEFLTYCRLNTDSCVFLVHVPELRRFTEEAKKSMSELAWANAQSVLEGRSNSPQATLVVGVRGAVLYESIMIGSPEPGPGKDNGIKQRGSGVTDIPLLYPFFASVNIDRQRETLPTIDRVRLEVAEVLGRKADEVDVKKPLMDQGADELDMVEVIMALEEAFHIEIPDSAIGGKSDETNRKLSVERLAEIVSQQRKDQ